jgi:signal transduction histidine kinase
MFFTAGLIIAFNVILPVAFGDLRFIPYASLFMLPFIGIISYSIYRHKLFNLKVFAAGTMVFLLAGLTFFEVVFTEELPVLIFRGALLLLVLVAGTQLIRSVMKEIEQREHIEQLAGELKAANEKLKELDKLKSQFLSIASHDLRAPLTVIRNYVSLVLDGSYGKMPKAAEEGLHQVFERATDMAKSVDTYLNVSRIEQGRMKYDFIDVDLAPILKKATADFKPNAEKKGLVMNMAVASALEGKKAKVDVAKLNEILNNLLDNSIKYTPKGSISVSAELVGKIARVTISDTGIGMSKETIAKLFQLFSTGESSLKVNISSTGVGLYITKAHVLAHKGRVWAESEGEGKGSRFILELPLLN